MDVREAEALLGVSLSSVDEVALKKAYRKAARVHHPDLGGSHDTFVLVDRAYKLLTDHKAGKISRVRRVVRQERATHHSMFTFTTTPA